MSKKGIQIVGRVIILEQTFSIKSRALISKDLGTTGPTYFVKGIRAAMEARISRAEVG